jgi:hypothetical protein
MPVPSRFSKGRDFRLLVTAIAVASRGSRRTVALNPSAKVLHEQPLETGLPMSHSRSAKYAVRLGLSGSSPLGESQVRSAGLKMSATIHKSTDARASCFAVGSRHGHSQPGTPLRAEITVTRSKQRTDFPPARYTFAPGSCTPFAQIRATQKSAADASSACHSPRTAGHNPFLPVTLCRVESAVSHRKQRTGARSTRHSREGVTTSLFGGSAHGIV